MNTKLRVSIAFISIFTLGLLSGVLLRPLLPFTDGDGPESYHAQQRNADTERRGQGRRHDARHMQHMRGEITRQLSLDQSQERALFSAIQENRQERQQLMNHHREQVRQEMHRQQREFELQLDNILTENQRAAWDSLYSREALRERRRN